MRRKSPGDPPLIGPVRLYLEDVTALFNEVASLSGGAQLDTDEWQLDGPDELTKLGTTRITTLRLRGRNSSPVYVNIWPHGAYVGRWGDDAETVVAQGKLRDVLLACRKRPYWLFSWWSYALWFPLFTGGFIVALWGFGGTAGRIAGVVLFALGLFGLLQLIWHRSFRVAVVYLRNRRDSPSFLKRNSDTVIVTGFVSVVVAVVSILLTYYLTRPHTPPSQNQPATTQTTKP